jgi:hypothetical protein
MKLIKFEEIPGDDYDLYAQIEYSVWFFKWTRTYIGRGTSWINLKTRRSANAFTACLISDEWTLWKKGL